MINSWKYINKSNKPIKMLAKTFQKFLFTSAKFHTTFPGSKFQILLRCLHTIYFHHRCPCMKDSNAVLFTRNLLSTHIRTLSVLKTDTSTTETDNTVNETNDTSEIIIQMAADIRQRASSVDKMVLSVSNTAMSDYINSLFGIEMASKDIETFLTSNAEMLRIPLQNWQAILMTLSNYGLNNKNMQETLRNFPLILGLESKHLENVFECLRSMKIFDDNVKQIIIHNPQIVTFQPSELLKRSNELRHLFKTDDVIFLIRKSPSILVQDWDLIYEKFHYVFSVMGITQPQMRHSNLFSYPIEHIKARHLWVEWCGLFKKNKHKEERKLNPRLGSIIDLPDKAFTKRFGNMSAEDYQIFYKLLQQEISEDLEDDTDNDE